MHLQTYLFLNGRCEEALDFYSDAIGAEITFLTRFKEAPDPSCCPPGADEQIMHATFRIGDTTVMASDGRCQGELDFKGFPFPSEFPTSPPPSALLVRCRMAGGLRCR